jgi:tetratricopeptide (TPR) repeat protein
VDQLEFWCTNQTGINTMPFTCPSCQSTQTSWKTKAQKWECRECEERFDGAPPDIAPDPLAESESAWLHRAKALATNAPWVGAIETRWPGPVAFTYRLLRQLLRYGQVDAAALVFKDFAELLARLSALILAQDLIQNVPPEGVAAIRSELFGKPLSMGDWVRLADTWSRQAQKAPQVLIFPEIASLWRTHKDKPTAFNTLLKEGIVNWRNETIGHGVRGSDLGLTMQDLERFLGQGPQSIHATLLPVASLWNDVTLADADGHSLMGADSIHPEGQNGHILDQACSVRLQRQDRQLDLRPWISARLCQVCGQFEIYLYDSTRTRMTIPSFRLVNYEKGHPYSLQGNADAHMLEHYSAVDRPATVKTQDGFDQDSLPGEIVRLLEDQSVGHDYLSPAYLRNPLRSVIQALLAARRGGVFWLQAPAHVGKSTFVRGLDPTYQKQLKEDPLMDGLAVAVFYIRREYQYHLGQFADQLRDRIKAALDIYAQNKPLPILDIEHPSPQALCDFFGEFQRLGRKALLVVIDGLDELAEEHPGIVDYLPPASMMPPEVTLLVTSRLPEELPAWLSKTTGALQDCQLRRIDLDDVEYVALMNAYACSRLGKTLALDEALLQVLRDKSDGRFLYFAFLIQRLKDGELKAQDIGKLADPEHLLPQYLEALRQRYANTATGDLLQRALLWMTAAEEAYALRTRHLPTLTQKPWMGLPMAVLCQALEGQTGMTARLTHVLYLLKPLLATWRGDAGTALYRLGIKGLREMVRQRNAAELDQFIDHIVRRLLAQEGDRDPSIPRSADLDWVASHLDGFGPLVSLKLRGESRSSSACVQALKSLLLEFLGKGNEESKSSRQHSALSSYSVAQSIIDWLNGDSQLPEDQKGWLRDQRQRLLISRGIALLDTGDAQGALAAIDQVIAIWEEDLREQLGTQFPAGVADSLAGAYTNRGVVLRATGNHQGALTAYHQAIAIWGALREQLGMQFPPGMADRLARVYKNRGNVLGTTGNHHGALAAHDQAIAIWEDLREQLGTQFPPGMADRLAGAYTNRGIVLDATSNNQGALAAHDQAIAIREDLREQLGTQFPSGMADSLAGAYTNRGIVLGATGNHQEALAAHDQAIAIWGALREQLGAQFPPGMADRLAGAYTTRGIVLGTTGNHHGALAAHDQAIAIWGALREQLGTQFPPDMADRLARAYKNRGIVLGATSNHQGALAAYDQAIAIREDLREQLGTQFPPGMADSLAGAYTNRGIVLGATGNHQGALAAHDQAIAIWGALREQLGTQFHPSMADSLAGAYTNRGIVLGATSNHQGALAAYDQAIAIWGALREQLGTRFPPDMADRLAGAYTNRGNDLGATGNHQGALAAHDQAIAIWEDLREQLGTQFPHGMADGLAGAYTNRGIVLRAIGNHQGALAAYEQAIAIWGALREQLSTQFPPDMADRLAGAYTNCGIVLRATGNHQGALAAHDQAIAIWGALREQLGRQFPPGMADRLAGAYTNRSNVLRATGNHQGALAAYDQAIAIGGALREQLGAQIPPDMADSLAGAYTSRGNVLGAISNHQGALAAYDQAIAIWEDLREQLGAQFPPGMADRLARAYKNRGIVLGATSNHQGALAAYDQAIAIREDLREQLGTQFPPGMADSLAGAYTNRGIVLGATGNHQGALAAHDQAIAIWGALREQLGTQFHPSMADSLAGAYTNRGIVLGATSNHQGALAAYDQAIAIWEDLREQLGAQFPPGMADSLAGAYTSRGNVLGATSDHQSALSAYDQAIAIWGALREQLGTQFPPGMADSLAGAHTSRGNVLGVTSNQQGALSAYDQAIAIWEDLREQLGTQFPPGMAGRLAGTYINRGIVLRATGNHQGRCPPTTRPS